MLSPNSLKLVSLGAAATLAGLAFTGGCGTSDNTARTGSAGAAAAGAPGAGAPAAGSGTAGSGTAGSGTAGSGTAGSGTAGSAGTSPAAGGPSGGAGGGSSADVCGLPTTTAASPLLYDGATLTTNCGSAITGTGRKGYWFGYGDASVMSGTAGAIVTAGVFGGCMGAGDCAFHAAGSGYTDYGAGIGFDLLDDATSTATAYDATAYTGVQLYAKGTITGTRGMGYTDVPQSLHIKLVTSTDRMGDDFGGYCTVVAAAWTKCSLAFAAATRDGFSATPPPATDVFDPKNLLKIQLEFSKFSQAADASAVPVAFDVLVDDVSFF